MKYKKKLNKKEEVVIIKNSYGSRSKIMKPTRLEKAFLIPLQKEYEELWGLHPRSQTDDQPTTNNDDLNDAVFEIPDAESEYDTVSIASDESFNSYCSINTLEMDYAKYIVLIFRYEFQKL
jgi:hypothetical protein